MTYWEIGDGLEFSAWQDCWVMLGLKLSSVQLDVETANQNHQVSDLMGANGGWNMN